MRIEVTDQEADLLLEAVREQLSVLRNHAPQPARQDTDDIRVKERLLIQVLQKLEALLPDTPDVVAQP